MEKLLIFAGTTEGRKLTKALSEYDFSITTSVATQYGKTLIDEGENVRVMCNRLTKEQMAEMIEAENFKTVIDTTHPYAKEASLNIREACKEKNARYIRILRSESELENVLFAPDMAAAAEMLKKTKGNVLVATGSKELEPLTSIENYKERLFIRVLPTVEVMEKCHDLGFSPKNIIAMQGPFSKELNSVVIRDKDIKIVLSKDSGDVGGFKEKMHSAAESGAQLLLIGRPQEVAEGISLDDCIKMLTEGKEKRVQNSVRFPLFVDLRGKKIVVIGGGTIATRRITTLIPFGGDILCVAPEISEEIKELGVKVLLERYTKTHLEGAFLVVAATNNRGVNSEIATYCKANEINHSICDAKEECSFFFPAICEKDGVIIGICGDGSDHKNTKKVATEVRAL